jgi:hypothetical protein
MDSTMDDLSCRAQLVLRVVLILESHQTHITVVKSVFGPFQHFDQDTRRPIPHVNVMRRLDPRASHHILSIPTESDPVPRRLADLVLEPMERMYGDRKRVFWLIRIYHPRSDGQDPYGPIAGVDNHVPTRTVKGDLLDERGRYLLFPDDPPRSGVVDPEHPVPRTSIDSIPARIESRECQVRAFAKDPRFMLTRHYHDLYGQIVLTRRIL